MSIEAIIDSLARSKSERVLRWLFSQEPADAVSFRLSLLFDTTVLPKNVQSYLSYLVPGLTEESRFDPTECTSLVRQAIEYTARYLATPNTFLKEFLFSEGTSATLESKLGALLEYPYYKDFLSELATNELQSRNLHRAIREIDRLTWQYTPTDSLKEYLEPLFLFFKDSAENEQSIPVVVGSFIADKGIISSDSGIESLDDAESLAHFIKAHIDSVKNFDEEIPTVTEESPTESDYQAFLDDLKSVGIHIPPPVHIRTHSAPELRSFPPIELFISQKLRRETVHDVFHNNKFEYDRLVSLINNATTYEDALLNLETTIHLQKAEQLTKLFLKWVTAIRMKFGASSNYDAIR